MYVPLFFLIWKAATCLPNRLHLFIGAAYTYVYAVSAEVEMQRTAKIFMNNRSQAVRLPKEFQFKTSEVFIRKQGNEVILSERPTDWSAFLASDKVASEEFMEGVDDPPPQERSF
jgi:antitoxin VapB